MAYWRENGTTENDPITESGECRRLVDQVSDRKGRKEDKTCERCALLTPQIGRMGQIGKADWSSLTWNFPSVTNSALNAWFSICSTVRLAHSDFLAGRRGSCASFARQFLWRQRLAAAVRETPSRCDTGDNADHNQEQYELRPPTKPSGRLFRPVLISPDRLHHFRATPIQNTRRFDQPAGKRSLFTSNYGEIIAAHLPNAPQNLTFGSGWLRTAISAKTHGLEIDKDFFRMLIVSWGYRAHRAQVGRNLLRSTSCGFARRDQGPARPHLECAVR